MLHEVPLQMPPGVATQLSCWHGVDAVSSACTQVARTSASVLISAVGAVAPAGRVEEGAVPVARLTRFCTVSEALAAPSRLVEGAPMFCPRFAVVFMNCDIAYVEATVVTSLIVTELGAWLHGPRTAISRDRLLVPLPVLPPSADKYQTSWAGEHGGMLIV